MYSIQVSKKVDKFLEKHKEITKIFIGCLDIIEQNPFHNNLDIKPLKGEKHSYRLHIKKYRFLYKVIDEEIIIFFYDAGSRGNIY